MRLSVISCKLLTSIVSGPLPASSIGDKSLAKAQEIAKQNPIIAATTGLTAALIGPNSDIPPATDSFNAPRAPAVSSIFLLI
jgi:hypothetical protein